MKHNDAHNNEENWEHQDDIPALDNTEKQTEGKRRRRRKKKKRQVYDDMDPPPPPLPEENMKMDNDEKIDTTNAIPLQYDECLICCEAESPSYTLSCGHVFCHACIMQNLSATFVDTKKKRFSGLSCLYRCGTTFLSLGQEKLLPDLYEILLFATQKLTECNELVIQKASDDGVLTEKIRCDLKNKDSKIIEFCKRKYATYECSGESCLTYFAVRNLCEAENNNENNDNDANLPMLCDDCTIRGGEKIGVSLWRPAVPDSSEPICTAVFCDFLDEEEVKNASSCVCDTDDNASKQVEELEVIEAIYPDLVNVLVPPPSSAGDHCTYFTVSLPQGEGSKLKKTVDKFSQLKCRLESQLVFHVWCPTGYPTASQPNFKIALGDLSLLEMNNQRRSQLHQAITNKLPGRNKEQSTLKSNDTDEGLLFIMISAFLEWYHDLKLNYIANAAQRHRHCICNTLLTLRCPRCRVAIFDFDGCFAVVCESCRCGFCAWCFKDCGLDAHDHVLTCPESYNRGSHFGRFSDFISVHYHSRLIKVNSYIEEKVDEDCQSAVHMAIKSDMDDLRVGGVYYSGY